MAYLLSQLLLLGAAVAPAQAALAAWWTNNGPQFIIQNQTTNRIRYSACNSVNQPKYSYTDGRALTLSDRPKVGTPLAGAGWVDIGNKTIASIFYINQDGKIANALFSCNMNSGMFQSQGIWIINDNAPTAHPNSGLAAVLLGETAGYRVYYHDTDGAINEIGYTQSKGWGYRGLISQDINSLPALAAAFSDDGDGVNITVASPRDERNIAVTGRIKGDPWVRSTLPRPLRGNITTAGTNRSDIAVNATAPAGFSLPAWDGRTSSIGTSIDNFLKRYVWYIGNDSSLYWVTNQNDTWSLPKSQSSAFWPQADTPNAELAVAYDGNNVRIYYMVKGQLSEVKYEDGVWKAWTTVPEPPPPATTSSTPDPTAVGSSDSGLSTGAKAGIGVGVSLGAIALGAIIAVLVLVQRRRRQEVDQSKPPEDGSTTIALDTPAPPDGSPALTRASAAQYEQYGWDEKSTTPIPSATTPIQEVHQLDSATAPTELYAPQPMYELPTQPYSHELVADPPQQTQQKHD